MLRCVIEQDKVDSFNITLYIVEEGELRALRQIIEENGKFTIKAFEDIIQPSGETLDPKILAVYFKCAFRGILSTHFGAETMRKAFELVESKAHLEFSRLQKAKPAMQYLIYRTS
ncbi:hypothetical protein ARALYDRAFT_894348 [Arabidopsis lyrata subsp. lyrata]|uniref:Uncharacterized protein n=1 Tax=Arabidopsis lyrata subsp. lyrata TaxID=81972 RepID=D7KUA8_ARALL|nr:hypothetical protein ARALYDRAFT_894348 [Arabidopsis lyrata subsp. lyrata]